MNDKEEKLARFDKSSPVGSGPGDEGDALLTAIRRLTEENPMGFAFFDSDCHCLVVNPKLETMNRAQGLLIPHLTAKARRVLEQLQEAGVKVIEREFCGETTETQYWSESWYPVHASDGRLAGVACLVGETSRQKTARDVLPVDQQFGLAEAAEGLGSWDWDVETNQVRSSVEYGPLYGRASSDRAATAEEWLKLVHPGDRKRIEEEMVQSLAGMDDPRTEFRVVQPDGSIHWLLCRGHVFRDSQGKATRVIGVNIDITERKRTEQLLRESEELFRNIADTAPVMICISGPDGRATFFNRGWLNFRGRTLEEELGDGWVEGLHPEDRDRALAVISSSVERRSSCRIEYRLRRADGEYRWLLCSGAPRFEPDGTLAGYVGSATDITDLKHSHDEAIARQKLESVGVLARGIAHDFNNLLGSILAEAEVARTALQAGSTSAEATERIQRVAERAAELVSELTNCVGQESSVFEPVNPSALIRETMQLLKVSISRLSEAARAALASRSTSLEAIERTKRVAERAAELVSELMNYTGQESSVFEPVDVSTLIGEMMQFLKVSISKLAVLQADLPAKIPTVRANATQLRQVVLNLIVNASEALGDKEGVIALSATPVRVDPRAYPLQDLEAGDYIRLEVRDTGCGMTEDVRARTFDPFFTTKGLGRGLGLSTVLGIIRNHRGAINLKSAPGQGSTFEILLPCAGQPTSSAGNREIGASSGSPPVRPITVMLVEDEETLRLPVASLLRRRGLSVIEAADGRTAVEVFRQRASEIDVVILDMSLPAISGPEVLKELRQVRNAVKVVLTSAYTEAMVLKAIEGTRPWAYIRKPYSPKELGDLLSTAAKAGPE